MLVNVIVLVFFIFLKFIFSACDSAFAYVNKYVILQKAKSGDKKSISIKKLLQNKSKMFGILQEPGDKLTEQELKYIISESKDDGVINTKSKQILLNTLKFDDLMVKNVMIKRDNVDFIDVNSSPKSIVANFKKYKFTRIPVYDKNTDNIVGILNVKDILYYYSNKVIRDELNIKPLLRKPFFVSKNEKVEDVFAIMKLNVISMAIVLDKNSSVEGIITVEDIVEKLVGDIFDEFDKK